MSSFERDGLDMQGHYYGYGPDGKLYTRHTGPPTITDVKDEIVGYECSYCGAAVENPRKAKCSCDEAQATFAAEVLIRHVFSFRTDGVSV